MDNLSFLLSLFRKEMYLTFKSGPLLNSSERELTDGPSCSILVLYCVNRLFKEKKRRKT